MSLTANPIISSTNITGFTCTVDGTSLTLSQFSAAAAANACTQTSSGS